MFRELFIDLAIIAVIFVVGVIIWCNWDDIYNKEEHDYKKALAAKYQRFSTREELILVQDTLLKRKGYKEQAEKEHKKLGYKSIRNASREEIMKNLAAHMAIGAKDSKNIQEDILSKNRIYVNYKYMHHDIAYINRRIQQL